MRRALLVLASLALSSLWASMGTASACEQITVTLTARDALSRRYVLLGKVVENPDWDGSATGTRLRYTLEPVRVWKGRWPGDRKRFRYETTGSAACGYPLRLGAYYVLASEEEPMVIGHPVALPDAQDLVGALDRARNRPPLRVPEEALLPPHHLTCSSDSYEVDDKIRDADRIVVGRMAEFRIEHQPSGSRTVLGRLRVTDFLKGSGPRSFDVQIDYPRHYGGALLFEEPEIWFIGPREAYQQRALVTAHVPMHGEASVRGRVQRWKALGATCTPS